MPRPSHRHTAYSEEHPLVIVGAGISGLAAAYTLKSAGCNAPVLEQEPRVGGRCATLRLDKAVFDCGLPFFVQRHPEFPGFLDQWRAQGLLREWARAIPDLSGVCERPGHPRYCGAGGMSVLAESLGRGLDVRTNTPVRRILEGPRCWLVETIDRRRIKAGAVLLTPPLPTALRLISDENTWRIGAALLPLTSVEYSPMLVLMAALDGPSGIPEPGMVRVDENPLWLLVDNRQKGVSPEVDAVTVYATRAFSERYCDASADVQASLIEEAAAPLLKSRIVARQVRAWNCGAPRNTLARPCLLTEGRAPLCFAGDAFGAGLFEGAVLSGLAAARALLARLREETTPSKGDLPAGNDNGKP